MKKFASVLALICIFGIVLWNTGGDVDFDEIALAQKEIGVPLESRMIELAEIDLHVVFAGPETGEPVILIHGFPQFWYMWRHHIKLLSQQGYRVAAVDMRGYNRSGKPQGKAAYEYDNYAADIIRLMDSQGWTSANIVGHDIGGVVSWELVFDHAVRVRKAVIFSSGHPLAYARATEVSDVSWYRHFFRLPLLPELVSRLGGLTLTANGVRDTSREGTFSDELFAVYRTAWQRDHAYYTMLGSYRNSGIQIANMPAEGKPSMPVMYANGTEDKFIPLKVAKDNANFLGADNVRLFEGQSHWVLEEEPELTAQEILRFLNQPIN